MSRFDDCFEIVVGHEGGYVNDPHDPGGETSFGITRRDHPEAFLHGPPTIDDAKRIYKNDYWTPAGCDKLPAPYDLLVFDSAINQGIYPAVSMLQKALGVTPDGRVGPVTIAACQSAGAEGPAMVLTERALRYTQTANFHRYGRGWLKRTYLIAMECSP